MRLCNPYRTAFKQVSDSGSIRHLLAAGWREVTEEPPREAVSGVSVPIEAPTVVQPSSLKYKGQYLSWYAQVGTVAQLREVLAFIGIAFEPTARKAELQTRLRAYLKQIRQQTGGRER